MFAFHLLTPAGWWVPEQDPLLTEEPAIWAGCKNGELSPTIQGREENGLLCWIRPEEPMSWLWFLGWRCGSPQAAESAEQLSEALLEDLLEDTAMVAWAAETDRQMEGIAERRLQAPTLESMLLRMEEIQVRAAHQQKVSLVSEKVTSCYL